MKKSKKYIFVTGTSESGKSMISEYISKKYKYAIHIKMRDIIRKMYENTNTNVLFEKWQEEFENTQKEKFWRYYLEVANEMANKNTLIVMDTLRKKDALETLNKLIYHNIMILYIDADFELRVKREYKRLMNKPDISYELIKTNTIKKDEEKQIQGLTEILKYIESDNLKCAYIIYNNDSIKKFQKSVIEKVEVFLGESDV